MKLLQFNVDYNSLAFFYNFVLYIFMWAEGDEDLDTAVKTIQEKSTDALLSVRITRFDWALH